MYEPYVHSTGKNLMLPVPPWKHPQKVRDNWQAGPWDRAIQAKGLAILGQKPQGTPVVGIEDHFLGGGLSGSDSICVLRSHEFFRSSFRILSFR
jgi:hypothetical protein